MTYSIVGSGINFVYKSNLVRRLKQVPHLISFWHGNVKKLILWEFLKNEIFYKCQSQWTGTPGDGKIRPKYESINVKEAQEEAFGMDGSSLLWSYYQQNASPCHGCARIRSFLMMDFQKEGIELNELFVRFNVVKIFNFTYLKLFFRLLNLAFLL